MLVPLNYAVWYGPAMGAAITESPATTSGDIKAWGEPSGTTSGVASTVLAKPTRLVNSPATTSGVASTVDADLRGIYGRLGAITKVNELSQDDVSGAVMEYPVEGDLTLKQVLRLLLAVAAGDASGLTTSPAFKSMDGSKTRVAGTVSGGSRSITTRDGT